MKKLIIFLSVIIALCGLRYYDNGLLNIKQNGVYTAYYDNGTQKVFDAKPFLKRKEVFGRLDVVGDEQTLLNGLKYLFAEILWTEVLCDGDLKVFYAYAPFVKEYQVVNGKKVNIMAAISGDKIAYGSPLLKGSY